jgi:hypothetical protein
MTGRLSRAYAKFLLAVNGDWKQTAHPNKNK